MPENFVEGHKTEISCIVSGCVSVKDGNRTFLVTGGRDKKVLIWNVDYNAGDNLAKVAVPTYTLTGHNHFVTDLSLSSNNEVFLSSSWDNSMRLWSVVDGSLKQTFFGASKNINTCGISVDSKVIYSAGFDFKTTIWNTLGQLKA
jgi:guanine nucleotide-binding protein subunit beta-2-like 1 protein